MTGPARSTHAASLLVKKNKSCPKELPYVTGTEPELAQEEVTGVWRPSPHLPETNHNRQCVSSTATWGRGLIPGRGQQPSWG